MIFGLRFPEYSLLKAAILLILFHLCLADTAEAQHRFRSKVPYQKLSESNADVKIFRAFNKIESPFVHSVVSVTNEALVPVSVVLPTALYASARANSNRYDENSSVLLLLSEALNLGVTQRIKYTAKRNRPYKALNDVLLSDTSSVSDTYSFPSGHTSGSFVIATSLTLRYPDEPWIIAGSYFYAAVTSLGRMYWGVHYPSDVLAGMVIGAGCAALIYSLRSEIIPFKDKLFNQSEVPDTRSRTIPAATVFGCVIAADVINALISKTGVPVLENSKVGLNGNTLTLGIPF